MLQSEYALLNSFSICLFANFALTFKEYCEAVNYLFSRSWSLGELKEAGRRIWNMTRLFNCKEGFDRQEDTLPRRLFEEPLLAGQSRGEVVEREKFEQMLGQYYRLQGWDERGVPAEETLKRLGIKDLLG